MLDGKSVYISMFVSMMPHQQVLQYVQKLLSIYWNIYAFLHPFFTLCCEVTPNPQNTLVPNTDHILLMINLQKADHSTSSQIEKHHIHPPPPLTLAVQPIEPTLVSMEYVLVTSAFILNLLATHWIHCSTFILYMNYTSWSESKIR